MTESFKKRMTKMLKRDYVKYSEYAGYTNAYISNYIAHLLTVIKGM